MALEKNDNADVGKATDIWEVPYAVQGTLVSLKLFKLKSFKKPMQNTHLHNWISIKSTRIKIGTIDGFVKDIGLRSLRICTLDNRTITIPNYQVVDSTLENITSEPNRRIQLRLGLTYDTTPEKMELAMTLLRNMPLQVEEITKDVDVSFIEYGDFALQILFIYRVRKDKDIFKTQSIVNLEILRQFNANGLEFAFPTQTIYSKMSVN